jgi:hypothetical protein
MADEDEAAARIDHLLDAIDLIKSNRRGEAYHVLRDLIREDSNFEDAWLWMSVAVDSLDQASICLDNVLRVNPGNSEAVAALYRIRAPEIRLARERSRLRFYRDMAVGLMWLIIMIVLFGAFFTFMSYRG